MKIVIMLSGALCALMLTACQKQSVTQGNVSNLDLAVPSPTPRRLAPLPEEMESPYAPSGVFFLLARVSVETDSGYFSYAPGSKVITLGSKYVTSDGRSINLRANQVTNDLRVAAKAAGNDPKLLAGIQASIRNTLATPNYMPPPVEERRLQARPETARGVEPDNSSRPTLDSGGRKYDRSRKNVN